MSAAPVPRTTPAVGDLVSAIAGSEPDALSCLSSAVLEAQRLTDLGEQLVDHFVDQARLAGASWAEIGRVVGVSKQAAHQRHGARVADPERPADPVLTGFTPRALRVVALAHEEAFKARHASMEPIHLLLGLLREPEGLAVQVMLSRGATLGALRQAARGALPPAGPFGSGPVPRGPRATVVLVRAGEEAERLVHAHVGTEHLLLSLLLQPPEEEVLAAFGVDRGYAQDRVVRALARREPPPGPPL